MDGDAPTENTAQSGEYVVVARRYRPQAFGDLIGQGMVAQALKNAITTDRVGHAYLFTGARGVGKTSTARILAKALNCKNGPTTEPCGLCDICLQVANGDDVDVLEIDGASNRGIDEIRQLRSNVGIRPSRSRFKVYIIDEVHMLTKEAFNALLKTLEEPPEHVKFIFCTTEPGKIPITVLSRCQRFDFSPVDTEDIARRLAFIVESEGATADDEALELLARRAAGSMRDSQSLLEQLLSFVGNTISVDDVHSMFGTAKADRVTALLQRLIDRDAAGALAELQTTLHQGVDAGQLAEQLVTCIRDVMACAVGCDPSLLLFHSPSDTDQLRAYGQQWGLETLLAAVQVLDQTVTKMRQSMHGRILLEVALVRIANLEDLDLLSQVAAQVTSGQPVKVDRPTKKKLGDSNQSHPLAPNTDLTTPSSAATDPVTKTPATERQVVDPTSAAEQDGAPALSASDSSHREPAAEKTESEPQTAPVADVPDEAAAPKLESLPTSTDLTPANPPQSHTEEKPDQDSNLGTSKPESSDDDNRSSTTKAKPSSDKSTADHSASTDAIETPSLPTDNETPMSSGHASTADALDTPPSNADAGDESPKIELAPENLKEVWKAALGLLGDMTADFAAHASDIAISAPNRLVVKFLGRYNTSKAYCERPEKRAILEQAIEKITGKSVRIEFSVTREDGAHTAPPAPTVSTQQLKRQITTHPLVEMTVKLFDAQILKVDPPRKPS